MTTRTTIPAAPVAAGRAAASPKYGTVTPQYYPNDLREDQICPRCGADPENIYHYCRARRGVERTPLLQVILIDRRTGKPV